MSVVKETTIWCDGCGQWERDTVHAATLRKTLKADGWRVAVRGVLDGKLADYCRWCAPLHSIDTTVDKT